jgi:hypothetical protein
MPLVLKRYPAASAQKLVAWDRGPLPQSCAPALSDVGDRRDREVVLVVVRPPFVRHPLVFHEPHARDALDQCGAAADCAGVPCHHHVHRVGFARHPQPDERIPSHDGLERERLRL